MANFVFYNPLLPLNFKWNTFYMAVLAFEFKVLNFVSALCWYQDKSSMIVAD